MDPVQQARLNPTPVTIQTPTGSGLFRATGDFGSAIYKLNPDGTYTALDVTKIGRQQLTAGQTPDQYGNFSSLAGVNAGAQAQAGLNYLQSQYGINYNDLPTFNTADIQNFSSQQYGGDLGAFFQNLSGAQSKQSTINTQANTLGTPQPGTQQNNATNVVQPSQQPQGNALPVDQSAVNPNAPQGPNGIQGTVQTPQAQTVPQGNMTTLSVVDYLNSVGQPSSFQARQQLAQQFGIQNYTGTANQNTELLNRLRGGTGQSVQQSLNQAQSQAIDIQKQIEALNSPANTGNIATPQTQTGDTQTQNIVNVWSEVSKQLGLSDIKSTYEKTIDDQKKLEDKRNEEASVINNNPWYSEGKRQMELKKLDSKYETKLKTLSNYAKLYDSLYQEARDTAEFLTTGIQKDQQFALELAQKKQDAIDALSKDNTVVSVNGREVLVNKATGAVVADLGASKVAGDGGLTNYQQTQAFIGISNKFQADAIVNQAIKGQTAVAIAQQVIANPSSATNQLKSLYSLVKNLDPDSAVREGEIALANQTTSYLQRFKTSLDRITNGQVIAPEAAKALAQATVELASAWNDTAQRRITQYQSQANTAGIGSQFSQYLGGFQISPNNTSSGGGTNFDYLKTSLSIDDSKKTAYLPRSVWSTIQDKDALLADIASDGYTLLIND